ncbi:MAG: DNA ligase D [Burkholderiales bacterium]
MATSNALADYHRMRDFAHTSEPRGELGRSAERLSFVIQKHAARSLHYDFRLELDGTLKSWAVPKGPSLDPSVKRMAVQVEDHPLSYADFEGTIPPKHYGAGTVIVWDRGAWSPVGDARQGLRDGHIKFDLDGEKLHGRWALVRMKPRGGERQPSWLLMKERDAQARPADEFDVLTAEPDSVLRKPARKSAVEPAGKAAPIANAALPETLAPQLATLVDAIPPGDDWLYEIKFDGYRLLTRVDGKSVRCFTRNGNDWSAKLPKLADAIRALKLTPCWLDGEVVVQGANGAPDFQALQNAFDTRHTAELNYFVFDLPFHDGADLRALPLTERRARLQKLLSTKPQPLIRFSDAFAGDPATLLASAREAGLEGLIGKREDSSYCAGARSPDWVKLKTLQRQEFVIGGYTDPKGSRTGIGALLLGVHDDKGALRYAGNVGTGFDERTLASLEQRLRKLGSARSPFSDAPDKVGARGDMKPHWVIPRLLAEVSFAQWTTTGRIRHSVFHGLRDDKPAQQIVKEKPMAATRSTPAAAKARVTHAERVIDAASGVTKGELVDFYARVAPLMLPHLKARPVALVRAPAGVTGAQFFQKHADENALPGIAQLDTALDPGHEALLVVASAKGLQSAAQMNVIELHTWNMTTRSMPKPDRMIFDLDPGEGVAWPAVREAAQLMKSFLDELGLTSLLKTSGGKGLHVIVPLAPKHTWQTVRQFSQAIVVHMAQVVPQRFVAKSGPRNRVGKIFIDYLRNGWGATTASAWSARARPGLGVSVPMAWSELAQVDGGAHWTVRNVDSRLARGNEAWGAFASSRQSLAKAMKALAFKPEDDS